MNRIRELRKESALTLKELSTKVGVAESTLSLYETGKREPEYAILLKFANFFRVSTDYLLGRDYEVTQEEIDAGWRNTKKIDVTPDEDELIYWLRELGKAYGKETQHAQITTIVSMIKNIVEAKK